MGESGKVTVGLMIFAVFSVVTASIFFMLDKSTRLSNGLYTNLTSDIQFEYKTPLTPISWLNNQWNAVFVWLAFFVIYGFSTTSRRVHYNSDLSSDFAERASYLYKHPHGGVVPYIVYSAIVVLSGLSVAYLFFWDMLYFRACAALTLFSAVLAHFAYLRMAYHTFQCQTVLFDCAKTVDVWVLRILGMNGLALLSSWLTYLGLLNLSVALVYNDGGDSLNLTGTSPETAGKICTGIYLGWLGVSFLGDLFFVEKYTRYVLVHYISTMLCGCGIVLFRPYVYGDFPLSTLLGFAILGLAGVAFVVKLTFAVVRHFSHPLRNENKDINDFLF